MNLLATKVAGLPLADWDLVSFFENSKEYLGIAGGAALTLAGLIAVVWGGILIVKKLMSQQDQTSWVKIIGLIIIGGALMGSGGKIIFDISSGGEKTIKDLGGGFIMATQYYLPGLHIPGLM